MPRIDRSLSLGFRTLSLIGSDCINRRSVRPKSSGCAAVRGLERNDRCFLEWHQRADGHHVWAIPLMDTCI
jgi:hypothetical protein